MHAVCLEKKTRTQKQMQNNTRQHFLIQIQNQKKHTKGKKHTESAKKVNNKCTEKVCFYKNLKRNYIF